MALIQLYKGVNVDTKCVDYNVDRLWCFHLAHTRMLLRTFVFIELWVLGHTQMLLRTCVFIA